MAGIGIFMIFEGYMPTTNTMVQLAETYKRIGESIKQAVAQIVQVQ